MKTRLKEIYARHQRISHMIAIGECTVNCAGAINADTSCFCRCGGFNHGGLWFDEVAVSHNEQDAA